LLKILKKNLIKNSGRTEL